MENGITEHCKLKSTQTEHRPESQATSSISYKLEATIIIKYEPALKPVVLKK